VKPSTKWAGRYCFILLTAPDLTPCDFHLFGPLKEALRGKKFQDNKDVKQFVGNWFKHQDKEFFAAGIKS